MVKIKTRDDVLAELDAMSRDLLLLTRTVAIYPEGHPQISQMAARLALWARESDDPEGITVGLTSSEMVVKGQFYGGPNTKVETLAMRLHQKRIAKISWGPEITEAEVYSFARVLSDHAVEGDLFLKAMEDAGIKNISIAPLDLDALHDRMRLMDIDVSAADAERRKRLWQWLQEVAGSPKELGRALMDEEFWKDALVDDPQTQSEFVEILAGLGSLVDRALQTVPDVRRADILEKLSDVGLKLTPQNLAKLIDVYMSETQASSPALTALMKHVQGERIATVLGGLISMGAGKEERVAQFIKRFIPSEDILGLTGLVREWKTGGDKMGFTSEIWEWLESFLLDIDENSYMGDGYRATLDRMAEKMRIFGGRAAAFGFYEDPESHIDTICAGMVLMEAQHADQILAKRMGDRLETLDTVGILSFLNLIDQTVPHVFKSRLDIFEMVFRDMVGSVKDFSPQTRTEILNFARHHEEEALEVVLKQLAVEERISVRRFLVEVLGSLSRNTVPRLIQSTRNAPWYYTRNIAIVFGTMGDPRTIPFLRSLLDQPNGKLRKEALRNLGRINDPAARKVLVAYAQKIDAPADEARLAGIIAERIGEP